MKGIYVIDLNPNDAFLCHADDISTAIQTMEEMLKTIHTIASLTTTIERHMPFSYHFYPLLPYESDVEGEMRLFHRLSNDHPHIRYLSTWGTLSEIAKGTYPPTYHPNHPNPKIYPSSSDITDPDPDPEPEVFSLSLSA
jgi:hypothetical protein